MQMSASPLALLAAATPGGKLTTPSSGGHAHRAGKAGAEARLSSEQADSADMPEEASSFSRMLRDQTANASPDEARAAARPGKKGAESKSDTTSEPAGDTEVRPPSPSSAEGAPASAVSSELNALMASLLQGHGPERTPDGVDSARPQAGASAMEKEDATGPGGAGQSKGRTRKGVALPLDKVAAGDGQATTPGSASANREIVSAGTAATRSALGGAGTGPAASLVASESSQHLRAAAQRAPSSEAGSATAAGSPSTSASNAPLGMPINGLLAGASSNSAAAATVDTSVSQDIRRPEFVPAFSARIATLVQEGVELARVHLNPVEMGPVTLQLSLDGQQVRVDMAAEVAATRQVLEQALPSLAGALREAGFTLSGGGVSQPVAETANTGHQDPRNASGGSAGETPPQTAGSSAGSAGQQADGRRGADAQDGPNPSVRTLNATEGLGTEVHLDAQGRPQLAHGRGLVDTFA